MRQVAAEKASQAAAARLLVEQRTAPAERVLAQSAVTSATTASDPGGPCPPRLAVAALGAPVEATRAAGVRQLTRTMWRHNVLLMPLQSQLPQLMSLNRESSEDTPRF